MDKEQVLKEVQSIVRDVLEQDELTLTTDTTTDDVEGWDSLNHVQIIGEIQEQFHIKFSAREMLSWNDVGDLCNDIMKKIS